MPDHRGERDLRVVHIAFREHRHGVDRVGEGQVRRDLEIGVALPDDLQQEQLRHLLDCRVDRADTAAPIKHLVEVVEPLLKRQSRRSEPLCL